MQSFTTNDCAPDLMTALREAREQRQRRYRSRSSPITQPGYGAGRERPDRGRKRPPEVLTRDEVLTILAACSPRSLCGYRDRALIAVLWRTGLRISEALDLEPRDLYLDTGAIRVRHGKGDVERVVGIDAFALEQLREWLARRAELVLPAGAPVFCTVTRPTPGGRLGASNVRDKLHLIAKRQAIAKHVRPHGLRHTHAFELATEGVPVPQIQKQLGHKYLTTTQRYVDHLAPQQLLEAIHNRPAVIA